MQHSRQLGKYTVRLCQNMAIGTVRLRTHIVLQYDLCGISLIHVVTVPENLIPNVEVRLDSLHNFIDIGKMHRNEPISVITAHLISLHDRNKEKYSENYS